MPTRDQILRLLDAEPDDGFLLYALALDYAGAGEHERAVEQFRRTLETDPDMCYAYFHMARSLGQLGRPDEAAEALDEGLRVATRTGDQKAASEIAGLRTQLS